jgi:cell division protein FtsZ
MNMSFRVDIPRNLNSIIKVVGVGGGGGNAVNYMYNKGITGVDFIVCNTDSQALAKSEVPNKIQLGTKLTEGLGAGSDPEFGKACAEESLDAIEEALRHNTKMVFITAGMGGGTGTGAAPVIAKLAKKQGLLTVGIVTTPFKSEGPARNAQASKGIDALKPHVDALLVITNDRIMQMYNKLRFSEAFAKADDVLCTAAKGIAEIITVAGNLNVDFRDVKTAMQNSGRAIMGTGISEDDDRALVASQRALDSPLLDNTNIEGSKHILLNISYEKEEPYASDIEQIINYFQNAAGQNAVLKFGVTQTEGLGNALSVTVIATGFEGHFSGDKLEVSNETFITLDADEEPAIEIDLGIDLESDEDKKHTTHQFPDFGLRVDGKSVAKNEDLFSNPNNTFPPSHVFKRNNAVGTENDMDVSQIDIPAYLRKGVVLQEIASDKPLQNHTLDLKDNDSFISDTPNKFLNKDVD